MQTRSGRPGAAITPVRTSAEPAPAAAAGRSAEIPKHLPTRSDGSRLMALSVSSLALFWRCPQRWQRRYIDQQREPQSAPMVVGKAVGAAITQHYAAQLGGGCLSAKDADDICLAEFDESAAAPTVDFAGDAPDVLREQGREALRAYLTELAPGVRPVSVERRVELRFDGAEWAFVGYLDVEDEAGAVIDVKVGAKHVNEARAASDPQPSAYLLARLTEARPAMRFEFHSVRRGAVRSGERCRVVAAERTPVQLAALAERIAATARQVAECERTGDWPLSSPDGWWCAPGQCRHWQQCPGGGAG